MPPLPSPLLLTDLIEDTITEILLRIPPDEPAHLFAAALVCKPWLRIVTDPSFLSRYRKLHRAPPLLGYLYSPYSRPGQIPEFFVATKPSSRPGRMPAFVATTAASPFTTPAHEGRSICRVSDCRHGRVLMRKICHISGSGRFIVWDPITGDQKTLSLPKNYPPINYATAVLCAVDGCDHLNCHAGAFRVVCCGMYQHKTWVIMYSSETREWGSMFSAQWGSMAHVDDDFDLSCFTLIKNALYFRIDCGLRTLRYDLGRRKLSMMKSPPGARQAVAMELDDGGLGYVGVLGNCICIYKWSWQVKDADNGFGGWAKHMVMEIDTVLPTGGDTHFPCDLIGLVEGTDTVFINMEAGLFTLDLKSKKVKKVGKRVGCRWIRPYMSFYTPDCGRFSSLVSAEAS